MLVKVETRHNGDTRTPRKYRTKKSLSVNVSACEDTDEGTHRPDERRLGGARKEEHSLCENTLTLDRHVDSVPRKRYRPQNVRREGRGRKNAMAGWKLAIRNVLNSWSTIFARACVSSEYRTKLLFPPLLDLLDFTTDQGDRTKTKRDGRKKKGKGKRRRQEAKRSGAATRGLQNLSWPFFSSSSSALAALFSFDACKVFLAGILPRDPAGAPARTRPQQSGIIPTPLRCSVFRRSSLTYT